MQIFKIKMLVPNVNCLFQYIVKYLLMRVATLGASSPISGAGSTPPPPTGAPAGRVAARKVGSDTPPFASAYSSM